jgi:hypothetical protein
MEFGILVRLVWLSWVSNASPESWIGHQGIDPVYISEWTVGIRGNRGVVIWYY